MRKDWELTNVKSEVGAAFKARDVESLTKELKSIIIFKGNINWDKIEKFGKKSREIALKNHSPEIIVKKFERMLKNDQGTFYRKTTQS